MKWILFLVPAIFFIENTAAQSYVTYRPHPINRGYPYHAIYLDTINRYYDIARVGFSEGVYEVLNDSMITLKPIIANPFSIEMSYKVKKNAKNKQSKNGILFKIKHHLIKNNLKFNLDPKEELKIAKCFSAIYAKLHDERILIVPFSDIELQITEKHVVVSGWIQEMPPDVKSISFVPLSTYSRASENISFAIPIEEVVHGYKTSAITIALKKGDCFLAETLFMNYSQWTNLGSAIGDNGDTLVFSKDKEFAKLLGYSWNLRKTEELPSDKTIATLNSITDILHLYSKFKKINKRRRRK